MKQFRPAFALVILAAIFLPGGGHGAAQSLPEAVETISRARVVTRILYVTAHPDDESSGILTYLARGLDADVALLSVTRGEGGQNAIGPEQAPELGILRTHELLQATRGYGAKLFFTRAPDFGYSKTPEETMRIWNGIAMEDMVRVLRTFRPNVVINQWGGVHSGHGHHQATGILVPQAVEKAADSAAFPQQIAEGLRPWRVQQVLQISRGEPGPTNSWRVPVNDISPLWGRSYSEIGLEAFAHHRSQGITEFLGSSFFRRAPYLVPVGGEAISPGMLAEPLTRLADSASGEKPRLQDSLAKVDAALAEGRGEALSLQWPEAAKSIARAGTETANLQSALCAKDSQTTADICWELARARAKIDAALADSLAIEVEARANHSELIAGETADVNVRLQFRSKAGLDVKGMDLQLPAGWNVQPKVATNSDDPEHEFSVSVPADAVTSVSSADAIQPQPSPLISARLSAELDGYSFTVEQPVVSLQTSSTSADLVSLTLIPAVTLTIDPSQVMVPASDLENSTKPIELLARISYHGEKAVQVTPGLDPPPGWRVTATAPIDFSGAGDRLVRFELSPPAHVAAGAYALHPFAQLDGKMFRTSAESLPSLPTQIYQGSAEATVHVLDLKIPAGLHVGYVAADNDLVPGDLRQLGIRVDLLDDAQLAFGDLSRYDAIVIGIRAYELRPGLVLANSRLLDYVQSGGTLVVQYQRDFAWNKKDLAPFPAAMPDVTSRTTDENSPVQFLAPESPLLNFPNQIGQLDFKGWVQERGLYYWSRFDSRYQPILAFSDPGEEPAGGALVVARDGKGFYIYTGIAFFRQLPAGVPGAFRLFVNLLSQSRAAH